jgi:hypothetical protein
VRACVAQRRQLEQIPDYHLDDNAVCDGSSCGLQRPITDGVRGAARKHGTARRVLDSTGATHVPLWKELGMQPSTHFTPPPFTIILGLHHKYVRPPTSPSSGVEPPRVERRSRDAA